MYRMALLIALATPAPPPLTVSAAGVGPIHADTVVRARTLTRLLPGYRAHEQADESEGERVGHAVTLSEDGRPALVVHGDAARRLVSVEVRSPAIAAPHGLHVGAAFAALQKVGKLDCQRGAEERAGELICRVVGSPAVAYVGEVAELGARWSGPDDQVPPAAQVATLTIRRIAWTPR